MARKSAPRKSGITEKIGISERAEGMARTERMDGLDGKTKGPKNQRTY
jgi:hypothetical protein